MPQPKVNIAGADGSLAAVTDLALDVNIRSGGEIDIGDVEILGHGTVAHGKNTAVSASVAERMDVGADECKHIDIMAAIANTGIIYVGGSGVTATTGIALYPGDVYSIDFDNTGDIYVIASVNGEDVQWVSYN